MKVYRLPDKITSLVFDMDLTLYTHPEYARVQIDNLIAIAGQKRGLSAQEAAREIEAARKAWAVSHNGQTTSLSSIILSWGFTMEDNVRWRETAYEPERYLVKDPKLRQTLLSLSSCRLGIITNNPVSIAARTLSCLGIEDCFQAVIGLDTFMIAKPNEISFLKMTELLQPSVNRNSAGTGSAGTAAAVTLDTGVSIGDRYDIDLEIPLRLGMGAVQVDGVEDVYKLPELLAGRLYG